jgi:hypothetical protein
LSASGYSLGASVGRPTAPPIQATTAFRVFHAGPVLVLVLRTAVGMIQRLVIVPPLTAAAVVAMEVAVAATNQITTKIPAASAVT